MKLNQVLVKKIVLGAVCFLSTFSATLSIETFCRVNRLDKPPVPHMRHEQPPHEKHCRHKGPHHHEPGDDFKERPHNHPCFNQGQGGDLKHDRELEPRKDKKPEQSHGSESKEDGSLDRKAKPGLEDNNKNVENVLPEQNKN